MLGYKKNFFYLLHHGTEEECSSPTFGVPIMFTRNPKTKLVDYIASTFECITHDAFKAGARHTVMNMPFTDFMPLYLNDPHFERSLAIFRRLCLKVSGDEQGHAGRSFSPQLAVDMLSKLLKTQVVLIADGGVPAVEKALKGLCQVFRLLAACKQKWPSIEKNSQSEAARIHQYTQRTSQRTYAQPR